VNLGQLVPLGFLLPLVPKQKTTTTTVLWHFFQDHPGEPVPEGTEGNSKHKTEPLGIKWHRDFLQARHPSCHPSNSVDALKETHSIHPILSPSTTGGGGVAPILYYQKIF